VLLASSARGLLVEKAVKVKRMRMRDSVMSAGAARLLTLLLLSLCMLGIALADEGDPPGRVARLSYVQGSISMQPMGQQDWVGAEINRPVTTGDKVWSDAQGSRAELDIGGAAIRMGANTGFSFLNLDDNVAQMQVTAGTVIVHVRELLENQTYEVDTPNIALVLDQPGQYRVEVSDAGDSTVVRVADGQAEAAAGGQTYPVNNQQVVTFAGNDQVDASATTLGAPDGFDDWSLERDREQDQAASRQYVADSVPGVEDLDDNGQWQNTPDYGNVWVPTTVAVGWAPYSFGHWAWISPWGWTWIDNAPWGFVPFHYGRWARWHDSWCWVPGPRRTRPVYAPAMVAWAGGAPGGAGVSWFPLGPREVYVPGYHVSDRYVRTVNVSNTTIVNQAYITNVYQNHVGNTRYVNATVPGAVTTVPRNVFTSAQPVNTHRMSLPPGQVAHLSVSSAPPAIAPIRQSILGGGPTTAFARRPPQALLTRPVVARTPPPAISSARVRLVGPPPQEGGRSAVFGGRGPSRAMGTPQPRAGMPGASEQASGGSVQQSRPSFQQRPSIEQRPGGGAPANSAETESRTWADRAHALQQRSLPPSQPLQYQPPPPARQESDNAPGGNRPEVPPQNRSFESEHPVFRSDRPSEANQPGRIEQPPVNTYSRPPLERPPGERPRFEERRPMPASPPPAPAPHFNATPPSPAPAPHFSSPPPPPAPVPHFNAPPPPPAPVPSSPAAVPRSPPQHAQPPSRGEDRPSPRPGPRVEPRR
jgi:Family of unknown function (DUF6600)